MNFFHLKWLKWAFAGCYMVHALGKILYLCRGEDSQDVNIAIQGIHGD